MARTRLAAAALSLALLAGAVGAAGAAAAPAAVTASPAAPTAPLAPFYGQTLSWQTCPDSGAECAWLTVPLSYDAPGGRTIRLLVERVRASGTARGSLILNPGGPGAPGAQWAGFGASVLPVAVTAAYDIVGFDPRGVGRSAPLACFTPRSLRAYLAIDPTPQSATERRALAAQGRTILAGCRALSPGMARHVSTVEVARDLDILRAALGDDTLTYLGFSYGTRIGAIYADLFPSRVGRMVLDGAVDPALTITRLARQQGAAFDRAIVRFVRWCVDRRACPLGRTTTSALRTLNGLLAGIDSAPLPAPALHAGARLHLSEAIAAVAGAMYRPSFGWPTLRESLREALAGDGSSLLQSARSFLGLDGPIDAAITAQSVLVATNCADAGAAPDYATLAPLARRDARRAAVPIFVRAATLSALTCEGWPAVRPRPVRGPSTPPIVVIGTRHDPATPYQWSVALADQLRSARLVTVEGDGHTATLSNACAFALVERFLVEGTAPADGRVCSARR